MPIQIDLDDLTREEKLSLRGQINASLRVNITRAGGHPVPTECPNCGVLCPSKKAAKEHCNG